MTQSPTLDLDALFAAKRALYGDARMEASDEQQQSQQASTSQTQTQAGQQGTSSQEQQQNTSQHGETGQQQPPRTPPSQVLPNGPNGYPENTPIEQMTDAQEAAYWKHKSRAHEDRWKQVRNRNLTPEQIIEQDDRLAELEREQMSASEVAVADAKKQGATETRSTLIPQLVQAKLEAAVARRDPNVSDEVIAGRVEFLDLTKFLTPTGEVDADKVSTFAAQFTPAQAGPTEQRQLPDMGGGRRGPHETSAKASAKARARERGYIRE